MNSQFFGVLFILLSSLPGHLSIAEVSLQSLEIYQTHEWLPKPTIYFHCEGENKTILPDVKKTNVLYVFKGEESWQPLTEFSSKKCKRCGFYEKDILNDDEFDEWELCPSDFTAPYGKLTHAKINEFNATFLCLTCAGVVAEHASASSDHTENGLGIAIVIVISAGVTILVIIVFIGGYRYWQKKKRQQEQARFLKLFEEQDDIEDELGLSDVI